MRNTMNRGRAPLVCLICLCGISSTVQAATRLVAITGNRESDLLPPDETLFEIDPADASSTQLITFTHIPDTDAIGFNPLNGLIYRTSGAESYRNDPTRIGFRDNQYMETLNLDTNELTAIFNANPLDFGLDAPRPDWVRPAEIRTNDQTDPSFRERGENEYHALRDLTWWASEGAFLGSDETGLYKLTPAGESTFLAAPERPEGGAIELKGISFVTLDGAPRLFVGERDTPTLWEIDTTTFEVVGDAIPVLYDFDPKGIISLDQHPDTGEVYAVLSLEGDGGDVALRDLVKLDVTTGVATEIGQLDLQVASMKFTYDVVLIPGDVNGDGTVNLADFNILKSNFGLSGQSRAMGDLNGDTNVDLQDFNILKGNFGAGGAAAVPEPAGWLLAALGMAALAVRRVRARA